MTRQLGRASLLGGALCWVLLALALASGGFDPSPSRAPLLRMPTKRALRDELQERLRQLAAAARVPQR